MTYECKTYIRHIRRQGQRSINQRHIVMENIIEIPKTQVVMVFVATCIEATARLLNVSYKNVYQRMKKVGMIEHYIIPHYEVLHSESRENIAEGMVECLNNWEGKK